MASTAETPLGSVMRSVPPSRKPGRSTTWSAVWSVSPWQTSRPSLPERERRLAELLVRRDPVSVGRAFQANVRAQRRADKHVSRLGSTFDFAGQRGRPSRSRSPYSRGSMEGGVDLLLPFRRERTKRGERSSGTRRLGSTRHAGRGLRDEVTASPPTPSTVAENVAAGRERPLHDSRGALSNLRRCIYSTSKIFPRGHDSRGSMPHLRDESENRCGTIFDVETGFVGRRAPGGHLALGRETRSQVVTVSESVADQTRADRSGDSGRVTRRV